MFTRRPRKKVMIVRDAEKVREEVQDMWALIGVEAGHYVRLKNVTKDNGTVVGFHRDAGRILVAVQWPEHTRREFSLHEPAELTYDPV